MSGKSNDFYVYKHVRLDTNKTFYIGKGSGKRSMSKNRNTYWHRIVNKHGYKVVLLFENLIEKTALEKEVRFIKLFKRYNRCEANLTLGGEGSSGYIMSQKTKDKLSKIFKGKKSRNYSKLSEITKKRISKSRKKARANRLGSTHTVESNNLNAISNGGKSFIVLLNDEIKWSGINQAECARQLGLIKGHVSSCLLGKRKSHGGYTFKYGIHNEW